MRGPASYKERLAPRRRLEETFVDAHRQGYEIRSIPPFVMRSIKVSTGDFRAPEAQRSSACSHSHWEDLDEVVPVGREDVPREQRSIVAGILVLSQLVLSLLRDEEAHVWRNDGMDRARQSSSRNPPNLRRRSCCCCCLSLSGCQSSRDEEAEEDEEAR